MTVKDEVQTNINDTTNDVNATDESLNTDEQNVDNESQRIPYDRFKAKVDEVNDLKAKLDALESAQAEKERQELEAKNEYKTLYESTQAELSRIKQEAEQARISAYKTQALVAAGYSGEQLERVAKYVQGADEAQIADSIAELVKDIPPSAQYADPVPNNKPRKEPKPADLTEVGRSMFERLKASGKLRNL